MGVFPVAERSSECWLRELSQNGSGAAAADLRKFLRAGLARALGGRSVGEADLDDFVQDAMIRVLSNLDTFRGDSRFTTWAMAVAVRVAFSALRRRRYKELAASDIGPADGSFSIEDFAREDVPERPLGRSRLLCELKRAIEEKLTERQRAAVLGELASVPSEELAWRLGMSRNALYKLHHDARKKLLAALDEAGFDAEDVRSAFDGASEEA
jgi:RNA polymerase sigma-70 factor (ECF subfamily)